MDDDDVMDTSNWSKNIHKNILEKQNWEIFSGNRIIKYSRKTELRNILTLGRDSSLSPSSSLLSLGKEFAKLVHIIVLPKLHSITHQSTIQLDQLKPTWECQSPCSSQASEQPWKKSSVKKHQIINTKPLLGQTLSSTKPGSQFDAACVQLCHHL